MKVECEVCGIMCFDNCKDELKEMEEHRQNSSYHKSRLKSALKLQELVKNGSNYDKPDIYLIDYALDGDEFKQVCKYLIEESEK